MDAHEHRLVVPRTARYYQLGDLATAQRLWVVCHGYGQLAAYFIRHFRTVVEHAPGTVVVAPEGLSKFYLQGTSGRVGATWMTREDRLTEIEDYARYLDQLLGQLQACCPPGVPVTLLGFSQGASTLSRWLLRSAFRPAHLVLWASSFPEDVDPAAVQNLLTTLPKITYVCGDTDAYVSASRVAEQVQLLRQHGAHPQVIGFAGGHELNASVLRQLSAQNAPV
ncbi:phospholipase [Hymenobacter busanensis]|uniref:Phospholipase n=1 Tax=Hymenobacter busanensis TaxID=2607656 RepID=A0A7L4ZUJ4_9BACT|nr:phospholipase [Hymenobacter busanensis]KAA9339642.1 phospholipase [Hymenobacter busanensis]QHJ06603.1 phospholipase [Hymenobacter busanensis]